MQKYTATGKRKKLRVVIDTSVMISALLWRGLPHNLIELAEADLIKLCATREMLIELQEVLQRPKFAPRIRKLHTTVKELMNGIITLAELYPQVPPLKVVKEDPDDDMFIACALAAEAHYIISGDHHLLKLKEFSGIPIVTVKEFLEQEFPDKLQL